MKNVLIVIVIIASIVTLFLTMAQKENMVVIKEGNLKKVPLKMELNKYQDSDCGMVITDLTYASQVIAPDGRTWFFHDHGGFIHWLKDKKFKNDVKIWVMSRDTKRWIDGKKAYYSLTEKTPMGYGFGAYEHNKKGLISFDEMRLRMLRGKTMNDPITKKELLEANDG